MRRITSCKDCKERHEACHDTCPKYKAEVKRETEREKQCYRNSEADRQMARYYISDKERRRRKS